MISLSPDSLLLNDCKFMPDSKYVAVEKRPRREFLTESVEKFEVETLLGIVSLLSNKIARIVAARRIPSGYSFSCLVEDGDFDDLMNVQSNFKKLLELDSSLFTFYVDSAQLFSKSLLLKDIDFSVAFSLLVFSIENMSNRIYGTKNKKRHLVRFAKNYVPLEKRFLTNEIRQLEFSGAREMEALFKRMLSESYSMRCNFVHDAQPISPLSQIAEHLSMAFVSNDGKQVFPSYSWLRRVSHVALTNFLEKQQSKSTNTLESYFDTYETSHFKPKKAIEKGQQITENDVYLQRIESSVRT